MFIREHEKALLLILEKSLKTAPYTWVLVLDFLIDCLQDDDVCHGFVFEKIDLAESYICIDCELERNWTENEIKLLLSFERRHKSMHARTDNVSLS